MNIFDTIEGILLWNRWEKLEEYLNKMEGYLQGAKVEFKDWADKQVKELQPEQRNEFYDFYADDYWKYAEEFPRLLRNSFLVSAYSLLEYEMRVICKRLKKEQQIPIGWGDLGGDTLNRFKLYCRLAGLELPYDNQTWQEINYYSKVRNCIVHKNGLLKEFQGEKDLIAYLNEKGLVSEDTIEQEIALTGQFCKEVIKTMRDFLGEVYEVR